MTVMYRQSPKRPAGRRRSGSSRSPPPITTTTIARNADEQALGERRSRRDMSRIRAKNAAMQLLASYLAGTWSPGSGARIDARQPGDRGSRSPRSPRGGHDLAGGVRARARRPAAAELGALTFAQRGALLAALAKAIHGAREELIALAVANGGNTRGDAKFDIDGARGHAVALRRARREARRRARCSPTASRSRSAAPRGWAASTCGRGGRGVAVHINAFNFPAWGLCEKLACALLAGMPVIAKPATATALVAHRLVELFAPLAAGRARCRCSSAPAGALLDHARAGRRRRVHRRQRHRADAARATRAIVAHARAAQHRGRLASTPRCSGPTSSSAARPARCSSPTSRAT